MSYIKDKITLQIAENELKAQEFVQKFPPLYKWFFGLGIILIIPLFFAAKSISKAYWTKRYSSSIITAKPSFQNPLPLETGSAVITSVGENNYAVAVEIRNDNLDLSLHNTNITVELRNGKGETVYTTKENFFILPDQKKYIVIPKINSSEKIEQVNVVFPENLPWQKRLNIPKIELNAPTPAFTQQYDPIAFAVEGYYQNNSIYLLKRVKLNFILYDRQGKIIGLSQRVDSDVQKGERRSYKQIWPNVYTKDVDLVDVIPETDVFDPANLTFTAPSGGSSSDLNR